MHTKARETNLKVTVCSTTLVLQNALTTVLEYYSKTTGVGTVKSLQYSTPSSTQRREVYVLARFNGDGEGPHSCSPSLLRLYIHVRTYSNFNVCQALKHGSSRTSKLIPTYEETD